LLRFITDARPILTLLQKLFSFQGRLRRRDYWLLTLAIGLVNLVIRAALAAWLELSFLDPRLNLLGFVTLWPILAILVKRMHDRERPAWIAFLGYVPHWFVLSAVFYPFPQWTLAVANGLGLIVGLWFLVEFGIMEGTLGANRYGRSPKHSKEQPSVLALG